MKKVFLTALLHLGGIILFSQALFAQSIPEMPMVAPWENTLEYEWSQKEVLESKKLANTENLNSWEHRGNYGSISISNEKFFQGSASILIESPTKGDESTLEDGFTAGRPWGVSSAALVVDGEDWSDWNRISFWVYPDLPGFRVVSLSMVFHNDGEESVPGQYNRHGLNYQIVENQKWNQVFWEIDHLGRDNVTAIEIRYRLQGNEPEATENVKYYVDEVFLEKVDPDHHEGWEVAPGHIAYNHLGYVLDQSKNALASNIDDDNFSLINVLSGESVLTKAIESKVTPTGTYQLLDFSEYNHNGTYKLRAGEVETNPFEIGDFKDIYRSTIIKTINHFYAQRCGYAVEGIHSVCHIDWITVHDDKQVPINGGWHDAGDLSQGLVNTAEAAHAMFTLADHLRLSDPQLAERLVEEGKWGLDWLLKTRFGDGYRTSWSTMDFWTDGIIGTVDDVPSNAQNGARGNFLAANTQAKAAMVLKKMDDDPILVQYALQSAEEDWEFATEAIGNRQRVDLIASAIKTSLTLYEATGRQKYKDAALSYADFILQSQQQEDLASDVSLKGFFFQTPEKEDILHYSHRSHEQDVVIALVRLSESFSDHPDLQRWENALQLYADFYNEISGYTDPYFMIPAGIYDLNSTDDQDEREQILSGFQLNSRYYLKSFPVWPSFRGNSGTILSQAKGLATVANYLNDEELLEIAYRQLDWHLGLNPFNQSLMYGAGYRYAGQYSAMSGNIVGGLPVGVQTAFNRDLPYWPAENVYNWKEIWVHPSNRWFWLMTDFY